MTEAELALRRWKQIYDELVQADRELAALHPDKVTEARVLKAKIARLTQESDAALAEFSKCVAVRQG